MADDIDRLREDLRSHDLITVRHADPRQQQGQDMLVLWGRTYIRSSATRVPSWEVEGEGIGVGYREVPKALGVRALVETIREVDALAAAVGG